MAKILTVNRKRHRPINPFVSMSEQESISPHNIMNSNGERKEKYLSGSY